MEAPREVGEITVLVSSDPAANTEIDYTVESGKVIEIMGAWVRLVTDATAATRRVHLTVEDGSGNKYMDIPAFSTQAASLTRDYGWSSAASIADTDSVINTQIGARIVVPAGHHIKTATTSRQTGDNFGAMRILARVWDWYRK